jgi:HPt (histidine-containing phosphotransfer) domain-containing protein
MDPALPVLDRDEALGRLEGDVELWNEIRDIWLEDIGNLMDGVSKALQSRASDGLRRAAHALKGASANVGATRVAAVARQIELASTPGDWGTLADLVAHLGREVEEAKKRLGEA